jgi:hypothetical protein
MMSLIYLASALALGIAVTRRLKLSLLAFEIPALSIALGLLLWTWLSFICSLILPYYLSLPATIGLAGLASILLWQTSRPIQIRRLPGASLAWAAWAAFTATATALIGWLMWTHDLISLPGGLYSANATWADFGLHASLISHFASANRLPLDFPIAAGTHLTFPFIIDLLSAWFVRGSWSLHLAIFIPSLLLVWAFLSLILGFGIRLFGRIGGAILGLTLTLLAGSAVGIFAAVNDFWSGGQSLGYFLAHLPQDYTALTQPNAQITNFIADILLPQRAFLMGLTTLGSVLILMTELRRHPNRGLAIFTGGLIGLLPLVHAHTFVVLGSLVAAFWIESTLKTKRLTGNWFTVGLTALIVAAPQIAWQGFANRTGTGGHLALGWVLQPNESILPFWMHNYGLTGLIIIGVAVLLFTRQALRRYAIWFAPLAAVFIFANIYSLQPFTYDNLKLIFYVYLFAYLFAGYGALWLIQRYKWTVIPIALVCVFISASGSLAVAREFQHQDQFASPDDIALANWASKSTLPADVFLTTDKPNQPIATLAGRSIVVGYRGWLYNFNLNYQPRLEAVASALRGNLTSDNPYNAAYLAVSSTEPPEWVIDRSRLSLVYVPVYSNPSWNVYRLP